MQNFVKILRDLVIPVTILIIALILSSTIENISEYQTGYLQNIPFIAMGIAIILSWKFNRQQSLYLLLMAFSYYATTMLMLGPDLQIDEAKSDLIIAAFAIFIPINIILFTFWKAPKYFSLSKLGHLAIVTIEIAASYWFIETKQILITNLLAVPILSQNIAIPEHFPQISVIFFTVALILKTFNVMLTRDAVDSAIVVAILTLLIGFMPNIFMLADFTPSNFLLYTAIGMMICITIVQESFNMAFIDPLTQLPSRRAMNDKIESLGTKYVIAMLDIDHFKKINDTYGHDVGDQVLRKLAKHLSQITGDGHVSRYGGEEFAIIFSGKSIFEATHHLELLRQTIATSKFSVRNKPRPKKIPKNKSKYKSHKNINITVSIGVAERSRMIRKAEDVQKSADEALYKAKKTGRNRTCS